MPADIGGRPSGKAIALSASSARSDCNVGCSSASNASGVGQRRAIDLGRFAVGAPDQVRLEADDRIAAARGAAFDGFEQEAHRPWRWRS